MHLVAQIKLYKVRSTWENIIYPLPYALNYKELIYIYLNKVHFDYKFCKINFCVYITVSLWKCLCHKPLILKCIQKLLVQVGQLFSMVIQNVQYSIIDYRTFFQFFKGYIFNCYQMKALENFVNLQENFPILSDKILNQFPTFKAFKNKEFSKFQLTKSDIKKKPYFS